MTPVADASSPYTPRSDGADTPRAEVAVAEQQIPAVVSAAWELELVIAGGVTFALFQLPSSLDAIRVWAEPRTSGAGMYVLIMGYVYTKLMVYVLLGAFLMNLTARAYWVGLVGLHSVFPRGVDWDRMAKLGPAASETYRARLASLPAVIARVDNFASIIFSFAFLVVVVCLFSLVGAALFGALAWGINAVAFGGRHGVAAFEVLCFGFAIPLSAVGLIDKMYGQRWAPESVAGRRLRRAMRIVSSVNGSTMFGPIFFTLYTNLRRGVMLTVFGLVFFGGMVLAMGELFARTGALSPGSPRFVPDDEGLRGVSADYYESLRAPDASSRVPTIQSDVIEGPYVRLFIPYLAERHEPALASCPGATPQRPGHVHVAARLDDTRPAERSADAALACLARMHAVAVDGVPSTVPLRFYTHPVTGRKGMITYLATASLAPGSHVVRVMPPPRAPDSRRRGPLAPYEITFWK